MTVGGAEVVYDVTEQPAIRGASRQPGAAGSSQEEWENWERWENWEGWQVRIVSAQRENDLRGLRARSRGATASHQFQRILPRDGIMSSIPELARPPGSPSSPSSPFPFESFPIRRAMAVLASQALEHSRWRS